MPRSARSKRTWKNYCMENTISFFPCPLPPCPLPSWSPTCCPGYSQVKSTAISGSPNTVQVMLKLSPGWMDTTEGLIAGLGTEEGSSRSKTKEEKFRISEITYFCWILNLFNQYIHSIYTGYCHKCIANITLASFLHQEHWHDKISQVSQMEQNNRWLRGMTRETFQPSLDPWS